MPFVLYFPYTVITGSGTASQRSAPSVTELLATPESGNDNVVLVSDFGNFPAGAYQWNQAKRKWQFMADYSTICASMFSIATAYVCFPNAGATLLPIGDSGQATVQISRNGNVITNYTLNSSGVELDVAAEANDIYFIAQIAPLKPATLIVPGGIEEAPNNANAYVRQALSWVPVQNVAVTTVNGIAPVSGNVTIQAEDNTTGQTSLIADSGATDGTIKLVQLVPGTNITLTEGASGITIASTVVVPVAANPAGTVGLSAVNGVATTFMRSDAAPALNQAISPTWTGTHAFTVSPTAPTPAVGTNNTELATTAFVQTALATATRSSTTQATTVTSADHYVGINYAGAAAVSIMGSFAEGQTLVIKDESGKAQTNNITINANGPLIDGQSSVSIGINYGALTLLWNTSFWSII